MKRKKTRNKNQSKHIESIVYQSPNRICIQKANNFFLFFFAQIIYWTKWVYRSKSDCISAWWKHVVAFCAGKKKHGNKVPFPQCTKRKIEEESRKNKQTVANDSAHQIPLIHIQTQIGLTDWLTQCIALCFSFGLFHILLLFCFCKQKQKQFGNDGRLNRFEFHFVMRYIWCFCVLLF